MKPIRYTLLLSFACITAALAVDPPPDGGYPGDNTAEGENALFSLTTGTDNTALGFNALNAETIGVGNCATGSLAMMSDTSGSLNTADGAGALEYNTAGSNNTAVGISALGSNSTGLTNTGVGAVAIYYNKEGSNNTAVGFAALYNYFYAGSNNIAIGANAGNQVEHGNNNIEIGSGGDRADSGVIRIGAKQHRTFISGINGVTVASGVGVVVDKFGQLGTLTSSARYKDNIRPMDKASEAILSLKPVSFRYKKNLDPKGIPQFGLVAEDVAKVDPDLVAKDDQGKPYTVRYEAVNAMLLNEFLKEHQAFVDEQRKVQQLEATVARLQSTVEKVNARLESDSKDRLVDSR